ncbi:MAG: FHA domain-containing protein [Bacteriovorax sp.]
MILTAYDLQGQLIITKKITQFPLSIGRSSANDIILPCVLVSSKHAEIIFFNNQYTFKDLNSRNGSFLDDARLDRIVLTFPCDIKIGSITLHVELSEAATETAETRKTFPSTTLNPAIPKIIDLKTHDTVEYKLSFENVSTWWMDNWDFFNSLSGRKVFLISLAVESALFAMAVILFRPELAEMLRIGILLLFVPALSYLSASFMVLPGLLLRESYQIKPLAIATLFSTYCTYFADDILTPFGHSIGMILIFSILGIALKLAGYLFFVPLLVLSWFPHRWSDALQKVGISLFILIAVWTVKTEFRENNGSKSIFLEKQTYLARANAGKTATVQDLVATLRDSK